MVWRSSGELWCVGVKFQDMIYRFADFELDTTRHELRAAGVPVAAEPQVFALLRLLIEQRDTTVTKPEIIAAVWHNRIVSDSAIASRIKSIRQCLGDDGRAQTFIRTVHGVGFRFVADVSTRTAVDVGAPVMAPSDEATQQGRPSIAILPFCCVGRSSQAVQICDALPSDLITALSRLHWLFVIARGSSFRFSGGSVRLDAVQRALQVRYCLTGVIDVTDRRMSITVELSDTGDSGVVWSERFCGTVDAVHEIREQIVTAVASAVEVRIPINEARRATLTSPGDFDAWLTYHLGLRHMYRFTRVDNAIATELFTRAIAMEPEFARAYAGLSFTHFQNAFLRYVDDADSAGLAYRYASESLERDPLDPFGHFTMGRAYWLRDDLEGSLSWLEQANLLNPNYAQARYSTGWAEALLGRGEASHRSLDAALALSPIDPLLYGMLGARALSHLTRNEATAAAHWAERAAQSPGAHPLIAMIAAAANALNDNLARAHFWAASARGRASHLGCADFLRAFPFRDASTAQRVSAVLARLGFS